MGASFHPYTCAPTRYALYANSCCTHIHTKKQAGVHVRKATLLVREEISYFCSGKSVAPVSEAAKGEPRTIDRVRASFFVSSSHDSTVTPFLHLFCLSLSLFFVYVRVSSFIVRECTHGHGTLHPDYLAVVLSDYLPTVKLWRFSEDSRKNGFCVFLRCALVEDHEEKRRGSLHACYHSILPFYSPGEHLVHVPFWMNHCQLWSGITDTSPVKHTILFSFVINKNSIQKIFWNDILKWIKSSVPRIGRKCEAERMLVIEKTRWCKVNEVQDYLINFKTFLRLISRKIIRT